jgi:hypothetical protein
MKEEDIRPRSIFDAYLKLAARDAVDFFSNVETTHISCPACGSEGKWEFEKSGFSYYQCPNCFTLYVNPRPNSAAFERYYREAPSTEYWATTFYRETAEARREMLWKPKALQVSEIISRHQGNCESVTVVDIGGGFGIFAEEFRNLVSIDPIVIEPGPGLAAACREKGLIVHEAFLEDVSKSDLPDGPKTFVSFELFEHLPEPEKFVRCVSELMQPGDLFAFTTLSGVGPDIRSLWKDSRSVSPPHHLNFFNPKSAAILLERIGFEVVESTTPGKLDMNIMTNDRANISDQFWKMIVEYLNDAEKAKFQQFLVEMNLSSHMFIVCKKV